VEFFFFFLAALGFELRASYSLGRHSYPLWNSDELGDSKHELDLSDHSEDILTGLNRSREHIAFNYFKQVGICTLIPDPTKCACPALILL
jgi:hypothetical protein